jgi:hypothetical protein
MPEGIISSLTRACGGNVHDKGIVAIRSKSVYDADHSPSHVADLTSSRNFYSNHYFDQWVCWDFRDRRVCASGYIICTTLLKSWVVEGSLDGVYWTSLDRQNNNPAFKNGWATSAFPCSRQREFRFIRLTQTGKNHFHVDYLRLRAAEFFGAVSE